MMRSFSVAACLLWVALTATSFGALAQFGGGGGEAGGDLTKFPKELKNLPAMHLAHPTRAQMLAAARAGSRSVAVGDHGTVILSDDGKTWRQAKDVPTSVLLTSVCFVDDKQGWAVGHWGEILHTEDGGETWKLQRTDTGVDEPLFDNVSWAPKEFPGRFLTRRQEHLSCSRRRNSTGCRLIDADLRPPFSSVSAFVGPSGASRR